MKNTANKVNGAIVVTEISAHGVTVLETDCADFDAYKVLPAVVTYNGLTYTKTGWNSDRGYACYKLGGAVAFG